MVSKTLIGAAALIAAAQAKITVVWQGGSCDKPTGPTIDISPEGVNTCTLYNFFPNDDPRGHIQVTVKDTVNGVAIFQLPQSQENQHIQCGSLQGVFHQSGCYDSVTPALDVVTAECDQTGCNNLVGIPSGSVVADMADSGAIIAKRGEESEFQARRARRALKLEEATAKDALEKRDGCSGSTSVTCDDCVSCFAQGARVSPFISCPGQGQSCSVQLQHSVTITDSFSMSVGAADVFSASVTVDHSIAVTNGDSETFTVSPGQSGAVQYQALAQCGTKTVHNGDGSICAQAKGTFVLDNQGAGGQLSFVRSN
ncbi:hypothetical protein VHEMI09551 [[Torrubiella] hemipterigena]|uniref:Uncharacterized protein n=1 Tax=[Torrubiella] hemipterigena TaxID=1531966 RepID=A0A0A1TGL8_9HYPO|nr:hypothetical protein VHEMI09551 [[Torrubiella] hemipterigena]